MSNPESRCRLVLVLPENDDVDARAKTLEAALHGGDVASVVLPQYGQSNHDFPKHAEMLVPIIQDAGAAALLAGDGRRRSWMDRASRLLRPR